MAKVIEQIIAIKLSKIVKESSSDQTVISDEQFQMLGQSIPELADSILNDTGIIVEVVELD